MKSADMKSTSTAHQNHIEQIYREYKDHIYNYIYRLSGDPEQALDVTQQTFIKLITDPALDRVNNIKSYLFTIARNHLYDTWKKKKETLLDDAGIDIAAAADEGDLTDELAQQQLQQAVVFCVHRLTDKYREVMILRYMEDLSIKEIASITQRSESDIKVSLLRARQQFDRGLTQHMYLKVAKSRQQCVEMKSMLAPYKDSDIPGSELAQFEKHITQCQICAEDAEEQKRSRKLFAIIPLAGAPLSLDTSFNDAMAASTSSSTQMPDVNISSNALLIKVAASVAIAALIVGGVLLIPDKGSSKLSSDPLQVTQQKVTKSVPLTASQPVTKPAAKTTLAGTVLVIAKARLTATSPPVEVNWGIYRVNTANKTKEQSLGGTKGQELNKNLAPGQYRITARTGDAEVERIIQVVEGKPLSLEIIINAGVVSISTKLPKIVRLRHSQLSYLIYKTSQDLKNSQALAAKSFSPPASTFTLAAGDYFLKARFRGFGDISSVQSFKVQAGKTIDINIPVDIGMFKPDAILSGKNLSHIRNIWWAARKTSAPPNTPNHNYHNGQEIPMAPGTYILTTKLESITQESKVTIRHGQITPHRVILKGGIVKAAAWLDDSKNKRNTTIYLTVYDYEKYKLIGKPGTYIPSITRIRNDMPNSRAILPEGKYTIVVKNNMGHKIRMTQDFTVKDGDTKFIELVVPK